MSKKVLITGGGRSVGKTFANDMMAYGKAQQRKKEDAELVNKATSHAIKSVTTMMLVALHDEFGFGPARMKTVLERMEYKFGCISDGYATLEDYVKWLSDYGVEIK